MVNRTLIVDKSMPSETALFVFWHTLAEKLQRRFPIKFQLSCILSLYTEIQMTTRHLRRLCQQLLDLYSNFSVTEEVMEGMDQLPIHSFVWTCFSVEALHHNIKRVIGMCREITQLHPYFSFMSTMLHTRVFFCNQIGWLFAKWFDSNVTDLLCLANNR